MPSVQRQGEQVVRKLLPRPSHTPHLCWFNNPQYWMQASPSLPTTATVESTTTDNTKNTTTENTNGRIAFSRRAKMRIVGMQRRQLAAVFGTKNGFTFSRSLSS